MLKSLVAQAGILSLILGIAAAPAAAADAKPKFSSPVMSEGLVDIDVDVTGAKELYLIVTDGGNGYGADWADWVDPVLVGADGEVKLTTLKPKLAKAAWGQVGIDKNANGQPMHAGGKPVTGIGVHAHSVIAYDIDGKGFTRFKAKGGPDKGGTDQGGTSIQFQVYTEKPAKRLLEDGGGATAGGMPPEEALAALDIAEGLEIGLFASEPMFSNPTNIDIDARGRVWVTEGVNYRRWEGNKPEGDRIVILEDTDGDSKADKSTVFYQGKDIDAALGICVLGNKVIVSRSPNVFVLTDTDGDDKADKKEVLFSGIAGVNHDHGMHAFQFGPDGKLYFNFGNDGARLKTPDGKPVIDLAGNTVDGNGKPYRQGMVLRCNIDGSEVETLGHNFRNNYEVTVDSFGSLWQSDNDDDGNRAVRINYVMEFGNFGYTDEMTGAGWSQKRTNQETETPLRHWHLNDPGVVPNLLQTGGGSPTGITVYEGGLLPKVFHNQVLHTDAGPNVARAYPVKNDGAGYSAESVDLIKGRDSWFRPSDICVAPDGSVFVADWYDPGVGGHNMQDNSPTETKGRLYRLAPPGHKLTVPKIDLTTAAGAAKALMSPNYATRYLAWTKLHELQDGASAELGKLWNDPHPRIRARALQLLARIKGKEAEWVGAALKDPDADIRIVGLRIARELKLDLIPLVKALVKDPSAQVRRDCAIALRHSQSPDAAGLWAELALQHDGKDRWYLEALGIGADKQADACFTAWLAKVGEQWNTPAGRDIVWRSRSSKAPAYLARILKDPATTDADKPRYFRAFDFHKGAEKDQALKSLLE